MGQRVVKVYLYYSDIQPMHNIKPETIKQTKGSVIILLMKKVQRKIFVFKP